MVSEVWFKWQPKAKASTNQAEDPELENGLYHNSFPDNYMTVIITVFWDKYTSEM